VNPGPYVVVRQNPEFAKGAHGQADTAAALRRDLQFAKRWTGQFRKAHDVEDVGTLQVSLLLFPSQDARFHREANLLSRKAVLKTIDEGDKNLLSKLLGTRRNRCRVFVMSALERAI
jgi:hypothetical protein